LREHVIRRAPLAQPDRDADPGDEHADQGDGSESVDT